MQIKNEGLPALDEKITAAHNSIKLNSGLAKECADRIPAIEAELLELQRIRGMPEGDAKTAEISRHGLDVATAVKSMFVPPAQESGAGSK